MSWLELITLGVRYLTLGTYLNNLIGKREGGNRVLWKDRMRFFRENKRVFRRKITFIPLWHNFGLLHRNSFIDVQEVLFESKIYGKWQPRQEGSLAENGYMYMYAWLSPFAVHVKLSQHC